jgi:Domain of unknown function (DUF892)
VVCTAGYGAVIAYAELLGESEHAELLGETLEEEKETDEKLTELSKEINAAARSGDPEDQQNQPTVPTRNSILIVPIALSAGHR